MTYTFRGACSDCELIGANGFGQLVLVNYTPGNTIQNSNFVSFSYTSNQLAFTITSPTFLSGGLPASLPGPSTFQVSLGEKTFSSSVSGTWCAGNGCGADQGTGGTYSGPLGLNGPTTSAQLGVPYNSSLSGTGGTPPYTYAITAGSLPSGLTLNTTTGAITGTPQQQGVFPFTASVTDSFSPTSPTSPPTGNIPAQAARRAALAGSPTTSTSTGFTITVTATPLILTGPNQNGQVGVAYNSSLTGGGGLPPYTYSITGGSLPPGLNLNTNTGAITGTPQTAGTFNFTAKVTDSQPPPTGSSPAARARRPALAGSPAASFSTPFSIIISAAATTSTFGAPALSAWMLVVLAAAIAAMGVILAKRQAKASS